MGELAKGLGGSAFKRKREIFTQNKRSETGGDGTGPSQHTGGLISAIETAQLLAKEWGREPTPIEVFTYTHTKDHDLNTFVDRRAENYTTARERLVSSQTDESEAESRIDEVALYLEAVGARRRERYTASGLRHHSFTLAQQLTLLQPAQHRSHTAEEFTELRARIDDQQRQIAELKAHVMRLSGEPSAGTSSSDPTPATDQNVSTSQQQPLPSPDPDAIDNTLVTPHGTIAHPASTPPSDSTSDCVDEQPRRFDFGPF
ncbi:hypothetical protein JCGZ_26721 [Jatropha curcas]|uniref:Uncharacterized protein n=1 Tax=Jatropha curcas TaxID=180498 RepID=A0A067JJF8_JATCU|nr:hypothetical protein JCGZ_26721 [Jatropha curcas]